MSDVEDQRALSLRAAVLTILGKRVDRELAGVKTLLAGLTVGERLVPSVAGVLLAAVQQIRGRCTVAIVDEDKLVRWVAEHHPTEVQTRTVVRPAFLKAIKDASAKAGEPCAPDGTLDIPGVHVSTAAPHLRIVPTDEAEQAVADLWQSGQLTLDGRVLELPRGEHD